MIDTLFNVKFYILDDPTFFGKKKHKKNKENIPVIRDEQLYEYEYLLKRLYEMKGEKDCEKKTNTKLIIPIPRLSRYGLRVQWINFKITCEILNRDPAHVSKYFNKELGSQSYSINAEGGLLLKGRYDQTKIETILKKYIIEHVTCSACKSSNTKIIKVNRLPMIVCDCGSKSPVPDL